MMPVASTHRGWQRWGYHEAKISVARINTSGARLPSKESLENGRK